MFFCYMAFLFVDAQLLPEACGPDGQGVCTPGCICPTDYEFCASYHHQCDNIHARICSCYPEKIAANVCN